MEAPLRKQVPQGASWAEQKRFRPGEILGGGGTPYWPGIRGVLGKEEEGAKSLIQGGSIRGALLFLGIQPVKKTRSLHSMAPRLWVSANYIGM